MLIDWRTLAIHVGLVLFVLASIGVAVCVQKLEAKR